jgi:uncharacterized protein
LIRIKTRMIHRVGVLSDTHGQLRAEAVQALLNVEVIVHAGDVGKPEVLEGFAQIAPVFAVRGNVDRSAWAQALPLTRALEVGGAWLYVLHDQNELDINPAAAGIAVVISGHTHKPALEERQGVHYLNPGSAGPRRFRFPVSLAILEIEAGQVGIELITLPV